MFATQNDYYNSKFIIQLCNFSGWDKSGSFDLRYHPKGNVTLACKIS